MKETPQTTEPKKSQANLRDVFEAAYPSEMKKYYFGGENEDPRQLTFCAVDKVVNGLDKLIGIPTFPMAEVLTEMLGEYLGNSCPEEDKIKAIDAVKNMLKIILTLEAFHDDFAVLLGILNGLTDSPE